MLPASSTELRLKVDSDAVSDPPDLTGTLKLVRIAATGSFSVVYRSLYGDTEVAVKATTFPPGFDVPEKDDIIRKSLREFRRWGKLKHPNIVPLLGTTCDKDFGSEYPCIVLAWMKNGTLAEYIKQHGTRIPFPHQDQLIKGLVAGLEYLHSQDIVHGNFHPGNILVDDDLNARLVDFGFSISLCPIQDQLSYLWSDIARPSRPIWAAPELLYPELYQRLKGEATYQSDIYSLGSIIVYVFSGRNPWRDGGDAEKRLKNFQNPPRPPWPVNMPDSVWEFIERCWSPKDPGSRPSAQEVLSFCTDELEQLLQPKIVSDVNVVLFGALGSGKSSIINLLSGEEISQVSSGVEPCTERPRSYRISIDGIIFRLWDTMGFFLPPFGPTSHLSPYEHAHAVLRSLPNGVSLILLCADKDAIPLSLRHLYWLINDFFYDGRAPITFVVTHFDTPDEEWWERNKRDIAERTTIPVDSIPHACVTTDPIGCDQSKHSLKQLLRTYATVITPIPLRLDISSHTSTSSELISHFKLTNSEATILVEKFRRPLRPFNVVFLGDTGIGISSTINLISRDPATVTGPGAEAIALSTYSRMVSTGMQQFRIWDTVGNNNNEVRSDVYIGTLENACQLIRDLSSEGVDLLVFCRRYGTSTMEEWNRFKLFDEIICKGNYPVAVVFTHVESPSTAEGWWQKEGKGIVTSLCGNVIGHSYIPQLEDYEPDGVDLNKALVESRFFVEAMLEDCVTSRSTGFLKAGVQLLTRIYYTVCKRATVKNLMGRYGLKKEDAERVIRLI